MSADGATPVAREGARAFVHGRIEGGCTGSLDGQNWEHREQCNTRTADLEADRASRDASAVEVERVYREALERIGYLDNAGIAASERCGQCQGALGPIFSDRMFGRCQDDCPGYIARAALARVASLKGGANR